VLREHGQKPYNFDHHVPYTPNWKYVCTWHSSGVASVLWRMWSALGWHLSQQETLWSPMVCNVLPTMSLSLPQTPAEHLKVI
jgi:hypothetical protein